MLAFLRPVWRRSLLVALESAGTAATAQGTDIRSYREAMVGGDGVISWVVKP
jgi:hypothetical protein